MYQSLPKCFAPLCPDSVIPSTPLHIVVCDASVLLQATRKGGQLGSSDSKLDRRYREQLQGLMARMVASNRNARALSHVREAVETAAVGGAYLLTGKLFWDSSI